MGESGRPSVGVGAIVVVGDELLMIRRGRPPALGSWSIPGGRIEAGETAAAAIEREVFEECGLVVRCGGFVGWVERIDVARHDVILDFRADVVGETAVRAGDDAAEARWVPLAAVSRLDLVPGLEGFLRVHGILAPATSDPAGPSGAGKPIRSPS